MGIIANMCCRDLHAEREQSDRAVYKSPAAVPAPSRIPAKVTMLSGLGCSMR